MIVLNISKYINGYNVIIHTKYCYCYSIIYKRKPVKKAVAIRKYASNKYHLKTVLE